MSGQGMLRKLGVGSVGDPIGVEGRDERNLPTGSPLRVDADELKRICAGLSRQSRRYGDNQVEKLRAVSLRFPGKFVVNRVSIFGTLAPQEVEGVLPDVVATIAKTDNNLGRERVFPEALVPSSDQRVGLRKQRCVHSATPHLTMKKDQPCRA
jgi:hypothetical protein